MAQTANRSWFWYFPIDGCVFAPRGYTSTSTASISGVSTHPLRLLRMEAMPITMLATDRALAAFLRANSLIWSPVVVSLRKTLLARWNKSENETDKCNQSLGQ